MLNLRTAVHQKMALKSEKAGHREIYTVDPWTTQVWTARVYYTGIIFSTVNTTVLYGLLLVESTDVNPGIWRNHVFGEQIIN